ncbi:unnamed protein product [Brassicogethes aeneus]|nr:unnamed protein product [Brassicogethes aeneus]
MSQIKDLLKITPNLKNEIRNSFNITKEEIEENIKLLRLWMEQTPHLPTEIYRWVEEIDHWTPFFTRHVEVKSDETKRIGRNHEFEIFGTGSEGSFKKINLQQLL